MIAGSRVGPYQVVSSLGAGGMGEVYRARDTKLKREVALKVLPADVASDRERLARFQREAEVLAALNHPNIAHVYGIEENALVMELVEGDDLSQRIARGPIPLDEALPIAKQIAEALEAAHEQGIIHRDLKPANIKVRNDGTVKVLDFGLAKAVVQDLKTSGPQGLAIANSPTITSPAMTLRGVILGTAAYMAPEQAKGKTVDKRADIWAFGCVLYEMLTGRKAFDADDITDTIVAVMSKEPDWALLPTQVPAHLRSALHRCLEKDPKRRLRDIGDADLTGDRIGGDHGAPPPARPATGRRIALTAVVLLAGVFSGWMASRLLAPAAAAPVSYQRVTFQRGTLYTARFDGSGREVFYSAAWDGQPVKLFSTLPGSNEIQAPDLPAVDVLGVSERGELLVLQKPVDQQWRRPFGAPGTLLRSSRGGASRMIAENVALATWMPDGDTVAIVRRDAGQWSIERPIGTVLRKTSNVVSGLTVSPDGNWLVVAEKAIGYGARWSIVFTDRAGAERRFETGQAGDFLDMVWPSSRNEVWFNAYQGADPVWLTMDANGVSRLLLRAPMALRILDVSRDGRVLAERSNVRYGVMGLAPGDDRERDYSWMDSTEADALSSDGRTLLLTEFGEGVSYLNWFVGLRTVDRSGVVRLGSGLQAFGFSPDGKWALAMRSDASPRLVLLPTGAGTIQELPAGNMVNFNSATMSPDGTFVVFGGAEKGRPGRFFRQDITGGPPQPVTPEDADYSAELGSQIISPDGKTMAVVDRDNRVVLMPIDGGRSGSKPVVLNVDNIGSAQRWSTDGCCVFVREANVFPAIVRKVNVASGQAPVWRRLETIDPVGLASLYAILISNDERSYYYTFNRVMSDLFIVDGVR